VEVLGPHGRPVEAEEPSALEDAVDDGLSEVLVVEHLSPSVRRLVGGEDHRALAAVTVVDDMEEHVRRVGSVGQITDLVYDEERRMGVGGQGLSEASLAKGGGEIVDELGGGREVRVEAVLDGAVGNGHREMSLTAAWLAVQDKAASLGDEVV
jgi:hypothetical protein